jgi:hypothetical protein
MLDARTAQMLEAADDLIRTLPSSVSRTEVELRATVRGPVDWSRTARRRYGTGDPTLFICRPTERRYDSPLAHLLARSLRECEVLAEATLVDLNRESAEGIGELVRARFREAHRLRHNSKLAQFAHSRIPHTADRTLDAIVRRRPTAKRLVDFLDLVRRARYEQEPDVVADVIERRVLAPAEADKIFELQVGLGIIDQLVRCGFERTSSHLITGSDLPLFEGRHSDGRTAVLWWQKATWSIFPPEPATAAYALTRRDAGMSKGVYRPDFIIAVDPPKRRLLVEAKVTEKARIADEGGGITEMLAYLVDAESVMVGVSPPHGLVVAWNASGRPVRTRVMVGDLRSVGQALDLLLQLP